MPDYRFIENCSPTLAGLKTGSMFCFCFKNSKVMYYYFFKWNKELNSKGVYVAILRRNGSKALFYVFRLNKLKQDLTQPSTASLLAALGYQTNSIYQCIKFLSNQITSNPTFPHEIGLFLGYPLPDVIGFIKNKGQNCMATGYWKVYSNQSEALNIFGEFQNCKELCIHLFKNGSSVNQLTKAL